MDSKKIKNLKNLIKSNVKNLVKISCIAIMLIVLACAPYFLRSYYLSILQSVLVWVVLSMSWYFFSGLTKYVALGSVAFVGTGMYFTAICLYSIHIRKYYLGLPFPLSFPDIVILAGLICFGLALAIGLVSLRLKGIYFAIATFGIAELVKGIFRWWADYTRAVPYQLNCPVEFLKPGLSYYSVLATTFVALLLTAFLLRSRFGLALRMIGENEEAAAHVGVNTTIYKTLGFAISAFFMGLMGASYMIRFGAVNIDSIFIFDYSFMPPVMVLLGGIGSPYGPIIGATALTLINEYLRMSLMNYPFINYQMVYGAILVVIVLFLPNGILGAVRLRRVKFAKWKRVSLRR